MQVCVFCEREPEANSPCCYVCKEVECLECISHETLKAYNALEKAIQKFRLIEYKLAKEKGDIPREKFVELHCAKNNLHLLREQCNPYLSAEEFNFNNVWANYICLDCLQFASNDTFISTRK